jgi:hypothetical protein
VFSTFQAALAELAASAGGEAGLLQVRRELSCLSGYLNA